ncbi:uncharacterized protein LOC124304710 [Neodiprion virginianus]|uniref:uncharacterized protein LOC124304710 n=1 Tax=Neodiprion virginianus TaxID=2961670 RepID=UPI001EE6A684|nr:uncharacterized protein LOC124304710 [Neodiprion virginianus]
MQDSEFSSDYSVMLENMVRTLDKILVSANTFQVSARTICESKQIFEFLKKLLSTSSPAYRIVFSTASILNIVMGRTGSDDATPSPEDEALVLDVVSRVLNLMHRIVEAKNPSDGKYSFRALVMISAVCASGIRSCVSTDYDCSDEGDLQSTHKAELANCCYSAMMKSVIPNFNKIELDESNGPFYEWFVNCMNGIYDVRHCDTRNLSNYLAEQGYLLTLPRLTTLAM